MSDAVRLDVWLDVACLFKTRSEAKRACEGGKVDVNGEHAKPHRVIREGDRIRISRPFGRHQDIIVRIVIDQHVKKAEATCPLRRRHAQTDRRRNRDAPNGARLSRRITGGGHSGPAPAPRDPKSEGKDLKMSWSNAAEPGSHPSMESAPRAGIVSTRRDDRRAGQRPRRHDAHDSP